MVSIAIIIIIILVVGLVVGGMIWAVREDSKNLAGEKDKNSAEEKAKTSKLVERQVEEKKENKQKILNFLEEKEKSFGTAQDGNARITNNDVEKLLGVSNATAERYLNELEKEGALKQIGSIGQGVYYVKIN